MCDRSSDPTQYDLASLSGAEPTPAFTTYWVNRIYGAEFRRGEGGGGDMFYTGPFYGARIPRAVREERRAAVLTYVPHAFAAAQAAPSFCRICRFPKADAPCASVA